MTSREVEAALAAAGIDEAAIETRELFRVFAGISPAEYLWRHRSATPPECDTPELRSALSRRLSREPLAYIIGEREFFGRAFRVTPACLIPRADTETVVETALSLLPRGARFLDLCCGSGCIGLSVLAERPDTRALFVDISCDALDVARDNAARLGVSERADFLCADLLSETLAPELSAPVDAVISNPPYIESAVVSTLSPEVAREPLLALDGGADGLVFYRKLTRDFAPTVRRGGFILYEIGYDQGEAIRRIAHGESLDCKVIADLGGRDRAAMLTV